MSKGRYVDFAALQELYGEKVVAAVRRQMEEEAEAIVQDMKSRVPVRTGALKNTIRWHWNKKKTAIEIVADAANPKNNVKYGRYVEFSPRINKPFFYPAMDAHRNGYKDRLMNAMKKAIEANIKGGNHGSGSENV